MMRLLFSFPSLIFSLSLPCSVTELRSIRSQDQNIRPSSPFSLALFSLFFRYFLSLFSFALFFRSFFALFSRFFRILLELGSMCLRRIGGEWLSDRGEVLACSNMIFIFTNISKILFSSKKLLCTSLKYNFFNETYKKKN